MPHRPRRSWPARALRTMVALVLVVLALGGVAAWWARQQLVDSLAQLDGTVVIAGLGATVEVQRDALGIPTIRGRSRLDVARATGFVHAQDRFYQMDLARRRAAGELAEVIGPLVVGLDRSIRVHRLRAIAEEVVASLDTADRALLEAYTAGVNAGLGALRAVPFEYRLLRVDPAPWRAEDSILVVESMFITLQSARGEFEANRALMQERLPEALYAFLTAPGGDWDTPLDGLPLATPPMPSADQVDLRPARAARNWSASRVAPAPVHDPIAGLILEAGVSFDPEARPGSNNWVVSGRRTATGAALLANDMHLSFAVPHVWYRTSLEWPRPDSDAPIRLDGITLPGVPTLVVGSNGHVAWGFTNTEGDWSDLILLTSPPNQADAYMTPDGAKPFRHFAERVHVKGQPDEVLDVVWSEWGPVIDKDPHGRPRAYRWVAHLPGAINLGLERVAHARSAAEALEALQRSGLPHQNAVVADAAGNIGWTVAGRIPRRIGCTGELPQAWEDGNCRWDGWLAPADYPRIDNPERGFIATANNRLASGAELAKVGIGAYDVGGRERQIVDALERLPSATPGDMLAIQLDDKALFLERWRTLLLDVLQAPRAGGAPYRELRDLVDRGWTGRASVDSAAYYFVRTFRQRVIVLALTPLTSECLRADERFDPRIGTNAEGPVWRMVTERPAHLLGAQYQDWDALLLAAVDATLAEIVPDGGDLAAKTWGTRNMLAMRHPVSRVFDALSPWLDMPADRLPGDTHMPRVLGPGQGASERLGVSPGREDEAYLHMPGGQSGHPLSPFYRAGHQAWVTGEAAPLRPGPAIHTLALTP